MAVKLFVDFDGTITKHDVGNSLFDRLCGPDSTRLVTAYQTEEISARACFREQAAVAGSFARDAFDAFLDAQEIDPGFLRFVSFCAERSLAVCVLSDGLDYYIDRILQRHGVTGIARFANHLELLPAGNDGRVTMALTFPAENPDCGRCACCKRNLMLQRAGEEDIIVYIGEGYSDRCPAAYADIVFAKKALQRHCQEQNISYLPYTTFCDVQAQMEQLLAKHRLRKRHRAELKRREACVAE